MYFDIKNYLKSNRNHTAKHTEDNKTLCSRALVSTASKTIALLVTPGGRTHH